MDIDRYIKGATAAVFGIGAVGLAIIEGLSTPVCVFN